MTTKKTTQFLGNFSIFKKLKILLIFIFSQISYSQEAFVASAGNSESGEIVYSIGQIYFETEENSKYNINVGVQIPYAIYIFKEPIKVKLEVLYFPNPVIDKVTLVIKDFQLQKLNFQVFDVQGRLILRGDIIEENTIVNMQNLPSGIYLLQVEGWIIQANIKLIKN